MTELEREARAACSDGQIKAAVRQGEQATANRLFIARLNWLVSQKAVNLFGIANPAIVALIFYHYQEEDALFEYQLRAEIGWRIAAVNLRSSRVVSVIERKIILGDGKIDIDYRFVEKG